MYLLPITCTRVLSHCINQPSPTILITYYTYYVHSLWIFRCFYVFCYRYPVENLVPLVHIRIFFRHNFTISLLFIKMLLDFILLSFFSCCFGMKICENGLNCASDGDCQIGNHCKDFLDGKTKSTRCVPRDDVDDTFYCSLTQKSCESE